MGAHTLLYLRIHAVSLFGGRSVPALSLFSCSALVMSGGGCVYPAPEERVVDASGVELEGWVQDADAVVAVQAFDRCEQQWVNVQRATLAPHPRGAFGYSGYPWKARLIAQSSPNLRCLLDPSTQEIQLRAVKQGVGIEALPVARAEALACVRRGAFRGVALSKLVESCAAASSMSLKHQPDCGDGYRLATRTIPMTKAGNFRRVRDDPYMGQTPVMYHFEHSLLVGKAPNKFGYSREFRNYMLFDLPDLGLDAANGPEQLKAAWISFYSNFNTAQCDHRGDMGCGYASDDPVEEFSLHLVDVKKLRDPRTFLNGMLTTRGPDALRCFDAIAASPEVGRVRLTRYDVDRWFRMPLDTLVLEKIAASRPGESLMLGGVVPTVDRSARERREWLFVDHLYGRSMGPDLFPRLTLSYCSKM